MAKKKPDPTVEDQELTAKRELFCRYYAQNSELFGNGTHAYAEAFGYELDTLSQEEVTETFTNDDGEPEERVIEKSPYDKACSVCAVEAARLLRIPKIQDRITVLRNEWMTDSAVDGELASVIQQNTKLEPKVAAIREFNKVRGRIIDITKNINRLPLGETDLSTVIETLPKERQDVFYGIIADLIKEAELLRSAGTPQSSSTGNG